MHPGLPLPSAQTIHSLCYRWVHRYGGILGFGRKKPQIIPKGAKTKVMLEAFSLLYEPQMLQSCFQILGISTKGKEENLDLETPLGLRHAWFRLEEVLLERRPSWLLSLPETSMAKEDSLGMDLTMVEGRLRLYSLFRHAPLTSSTPRSGKPGPVYSLALLEEYEKALSSVDMHLQVVEYAKVRDHAPATLAHAGHDASYASYNERLLASGRMDYEDLLTLTIRLLEEHKSLLDARDRACLEREGGMWVLVDEVQDLSATQVRLLQALSPHRTRFFAVGDADQAIYGFRGAGTLANFSNLARTFPLWSPPPHGSKEAGKRVGGKGDKGGYIYLRDNFRSTPPILSFASYCLTQGISPGSHAGGGEGIKRETLGLPERIQCIQHPSVAMSCPEAQDTPVQVMEVEDEVHEAHQIVQQIRHLMNSNQGKWEEGRGGVGC